MTTTLAQILAITQGAKAHCGNQVAQLHHGVQRAELTQGHSRTYEPVDEDGETQPPDVKKVQLTAAAALEHVEGIVARLFDLVYTVDTTNTVAKADVVVNGVTLLRDVPVTYLLWLGHQLTDMRTFVDKLPVLDPAYEWHYNANAGCYVTDPVTSNRTGKVRKPNVLYEATDKHPAQVEVVAVDVVLGHYTTIRHSGGIGADDKRGILDRLTALADAVKVAQQEANVTPAQDRHAAAAVFGYLLRGIVIDTPVSGG